MKTALYSLSCIGLFTMIACGGAVTMRPGDGASGSGVKIAYVNGDSILHNYIEFSAASESLDAKQREAEQQLQIKGAALEKEIKAYQQRVQSGTLSRNEMEVQERRLGGQQDMLMQERDQISNALMSETAEINERLQKVIKEKLEEIKADEGYDFIFSYVQGGPILLADERFDITEKVLDVLNASASKDAKAPSGTGEETKEN